MAKVMTSLFTIAIRKGRLERPSVSDYYGRAQGHAASAVKSGLVIWRHSRRCLPRRGSGPTR
jgi:hypothetical protein